MRGFTAVEGLTDGPGLHPLQRAFHQAHGLQCGFCTPGFLMTLLPIYERGEQLDNEQIREELAGNLCRCTGYQQIIESVRLALAERVPEA